VTTILQARPRKFVSTPAIERIVIRAMRYLQSGFSVHLRGPAGVGKTTLALHLADMLSRPIMLIFGDDEFKPSDLIGNQSGYSRKKVVDNYIHSVVKVEDELRQNWVDSRLTMACREGFTLVYDEFNRSRPEVNNVLLSALEEKLLVLPPNHNRAEYIRVSPQFRAIFTSNPEEYCGVHDTQDALMDRLVTITVPEPDELTQQEIVAQKVDLPRESALLITRLVRAFRERTQSDQHTSSGLRACLMIAKVCYEHNIPVVPEDLEFRDICQDVLLSRTKLPLSEATNLLWELFNDLIYQGAGATEFLGGSRSGKSEGVIRRTAKHLEADAAEGELSVHTLATDPIPSAAIAESHLNAVEQVGGRATDAEASTFAEIFPDHLQEMGAVDLLSSAQDEPIPEATSEAMPDEGALPAALSDRETEIYQYLQQSGGARMGVLEKAVGINRFQAVDALRSLTQRGLVYQQDDRTYCPSTNAAPEVTAE